MFVMEDTMYGRSGMLGIGVANWVVPMPLVDLPFPRSLAKGSKSRDIGVESSEDSGRKREDQV